MATINPGQLALYATIVLTLLSILFSIIFQRHDSIVLGVGVGLLAFGFKLPKAYILLLSSLAIFLSSYLPFGQSSAYLIQGFDEGFANSVVVEEGFKKKKKAKKSKKKAKKSKKMPEEDEDEEESEDGDFSEDEDEGFANDSDSEGFDDDEQEKFENEKKTENEEFENEKKTENEEFENEDFDNEEGFVSADFNQDDTFEGFASAPKKKKRAPPPDHGSRAEMFELGKQYKMPKESDDPEYHLDAGTTFMNAYKSLKPDQVSAMTKDTQDLINTQKQLMATLNTLKPLITDGKQMMDTFQNYFGAEGGAGGVGDLAKLAEKFAPKA